MNEGVNYCVKPPEQEPLTLMNSLLRLNCTIESLNGVVGLSDTLIEKLERTYDMPKKESCLKEGKPFTNAVPNIIELFNIANDTLKSMSDIIRINLQKSINMVE